MNIQHIISTKQFNDRATLDRLFKLADSMKKMTLGNKLPQSLRGKILSSLFFEPSTRTRFSFEAAMMRLGGMVTTAENASLSSSATKGESLEDTIKIISGYTDVIVMRHFEQGAAARAAKVASVPVINAGDGAGEHPTQALLDLYTMQKEKGTIDNLNIGMVGDLLYSRTIHSQLPLLALYKNITLHLVSPLKLRLSKEYIDFIKSHKIKFNQTSKLKDIINLVDVLYVTRVQKERFGSITEYERLKNAFVISPTTIKTMKKDAIIMHPLPRVKEIDPVLDKDPRSAYFKQAINGTYIRMALLEKVLL